jgi:hypothetical protein
MSVKSTQRNPGDFLESSGPATGSYIDGTQDCMLVPKLNRYAFEINVVIQTTFIHCSLYNHIRIGKSIRPGRCGAEPRKGGSGVCACLETRVRTSLNKCIAAQGAIAP